MFVFCAFVIVGLVQRVLDSSLSIVGFIVHLLMLGNWVAIISRLLSWSYLVIYVWKNLIGPLSSCLIYRP